MARRVRILLTSTVALACLVPALAAGPAYAGAAAACASSHAAPSDASLALARQTTLCLLNRERARRRMRPLRMNARLTAAALAHARDMARRNYFSHVAPGGVDMVDRIVRNAYLSGARSWTVGENIAWGNGGYATPASTVAGWMRSPGHRANILNRRFRDIGVGIFLGSPMNGHEEGAIYATDFGARR